MNSRLFFRQRVFRTKLDIWLVALLIIIGILHSVNAFGYPSYREDEGTYMSQSWAVLNLSRLAPYTYWYDHAPAGWILLAGWKLITGDTFTAGSSIDSGRIFMGFLTVLSAFFVYRIAQAFSSGKKEAAVIATLLFGITPLAIIFHRHVLLDNIMTFWLLASMYFVIARQFRLTSAVLGALCFGLAVLSKESAIAFLPGMVGLVAVAADRNNRHFALVVWISVALLSMSLYPVFALLKGELFPTGTFLGGQSPHVSLWEAIQFQLGRTDKFFLSPGSSFFEAADNTWLRYGSLLIVFGIVSAIAHVCMWRNKRTFWLGIITLSFLLFIVRGQVLDWYIIPAIPLFALNIAHLFSIIAGAFKRLPEYEIIARRLFSGITVVVVAASLFVNRHIFTLDLTSNQIEAISWVKDNIPKDSILLIDNYAFVDLNPDLSDITKTNVHYYWKVDTDPQIKNNVLGNTWDSIDYVLSTPGMVKSIYDDNLGLVREAYEKSHVVRRFSKYDSWIEGYPVEIREVNNSDGTLKRSWRWYKERFVGEDGRVSDPSSNNQTTSEGQSYALLRAVWEDDRVTFDRVLGWTMNNLKLPDAHLFAWVAEEDKSGIPRVKDFTTASDADEDIALALLFAGKKWQEPSYDELAGRIIRDIWNREVVFVDGLYYVVAGTDLRRQNGYLVNPSYFAPANYRIFADADPEHPWEAVADDAYRILDKLAASKTFGGQTNLPPNWFIVDALGNYHSTISYTHAGADYYGYDAFRTFWRVALDYVWFETEEAKEYLQDVRPFFAKEWNEKRKIHSVYLLDGTPGVSFDDRSTDAGALAVFFITEPEMAIDLYSTNFWPNFRREGYWGDQSKYYDQNWAWFGTALYTHNLPNLWGRPKKLVMNNE